MKAKIVFMTAWMLYGVSVGFAAPAADITEQQSRVDAPSVMTESEKTAKSKWELPVESESMQVDTIIVDDEGKGFQWLKRELKEYRHHRVGADGLSMMLEKLNTRLKERGFITSRVVLPEQNISGKSVVFKVIPGYIEEIRFTDKFGLEISSLPTRIYEEQRWMEGAAVQYLNGLLKKWDVADARVDMIRDCIFHVGFQKKDTQAFEVTSGFSHFKLRWKKGRRLPAKVYLQVKRDAGR